MNIKSNKGYSLTEIAIGLIIVVIFMTSTITLLIGASENYAKIEQRNIALSYAMKAIETYQLTSSGDVASAIDTIGNNAQNDNNMTLETVLETPEEYGGKLSIVTANVTYNAKKGNNKTQTTLSLSTLLVNK